MASRSTIVLESVGTIIIRVDHGIADSFSRSVLPTSTRAWRRSRLHHTATYRAAELAPDWTVDGTHCASIVAFSTSHEAARGALEAFLDRVNPAADATVAV